MGEPIKQTTRAGLTKYPNIYKHVYWGWCSLKGDENLQDAASYSTPEIIENRNRFIEDHRIKRFFKLPDGLYYNESDKITKYNRILPCIELIGDAFISDQRSSMMTLPVRS